jgi:acetoin utilization deacetylase AcuC-like enzyme
MPRAVPTQASGLLYSSEYLRHYSKQRHPENPERLKAIVQALKGSGLAKEFQTIYPRRATLDDLQLVHTSEHCAFVRETSENGGGMADPDTYIGEGSFEVACHAAGGLFAAVDAMGRGEVQRVLALARPPGHHATPSRAMGFCLFNNVALAARYAQRKGFKKILIVDWDVHHGNGTQEIFYEDPTVGYFSVHQFPFYPGSGARDEAGRGAGEGYTANVPLLAGCGDAEYLAALADDLPPLWERVDPAMVFVSAGFDAHVRDPLAGMRVTTEGFGRMASMVLRRAGEIPVLFTLEGGYDLNALGESVVAVANAILGESPS